MQHIRHTNLAPWPDCKAIDGRKAWNGMHSIISLTDFLGSLISLLLIFQLTCPALHPSPIPQTKFCAWCENAYSWKPQRVNHHSNKNKTHQSDHFGLMKLWMKSKKKKKILSYLKRSVESIRITVKIGIQIQVLPSLGCQRQTKARIR